MHCQWPLFEEDEVQAVTDVLRSGKVNYWTGQEVKQFEKEFANYHDCEFGVAVANGTVALELALAALQIGPGDEVIVPSKTFVATASAVVMRGAKPVVADIDLASQNITVETIAKALTPKTKAIICVHLAGWPCEMDDIMCFAKEHDLFVIEDCAQAHGAIYKGRHVGSLGDIAAFSFCQDKIMTTGGEGGMVLTNTESLWRRAWAYKDHGKDYDAVFNKQHPPGFRWLHKDFGTNWRMTEMQAAIGRVQLKKLPNWLEIRKEAAAKYHHALQGSTLVKTSIPPEYIEHANYKFYFFMREGSKVSRDDLMSVINSKQVPCFSGSCSEIYIEDCFKRYGFQPKKPLANAKQLTETSLLLPLAPTLTSEALGHNIEMILEALTEQESFVA